MNPGFIPVCVLALLSANAVLAKDFEVTVTVRGDSYPLAIISTTVPADLPETGTLQNPNGEAAFQKTGPESATFIVRGLQRGETRKFTVKPGAAAGMKANAALENGNIVLSVGGKTVLTYRGEETEPPRPEIKAVYKRGGYLHPVLSPSGKQITDDFPPNHIHHHGLWFPWTKTVFEGRDVDFWNMGEGKGKVEFVKLGTTWSGPVHAGFTAYHQFIDLTSGQPKAALDETWTVNVYALPNSDYFMFDLVSTQRCSTSAPLLLPKYYYGGLGFRGSWGWNGADKCRFLTSNGETDRVKGNETRANWCHIGGTVDGAFTGIALLGHPDNFRAPQPMRLHPKEPFFCFAPSQLGDWAIEPGKPYVSRYRFIVKDGEPDKAQLDELWRAYANPPQVTVNAN